jgi:phage gp45-like
MAINYKNYITQNVGTTPTTVYNPTTVGVQSTLIGFNITNTNSIPVTANVTLTSGATTVYMIKNVMLPVGNALNLIDSGKMVMEQNDVIQVSCSSASSVDVIVSTVEVS